MEPHLMEAFPWIVAMVFVLGFDISGRSRRMAKARQRSTRAGAIGRTVTEVRDEVGFDSRR